MLLRGWLSSGAWGTPAIPVCVLVPAAFPTLLSPSCQGSAAADLQMLPQRIPFPCCPAAVGAPLAPDYLQGPAGFPNIPCAPP